MKTRKVIPCLLCGEPTPMLGTRLCDGCWELDRRIQSTPDIARSILANLGGESAEGRLGYLEAALREIADLSPGTEYQMSVAREIARDALAGYWKRPEQKQQT